MIFTDAQVTVNGTTDDISEYVSSVTLEGTRSEHDNTTMGAGAKTREVGLTDGSVSLEFVDDYDAAKLDAIIWGIFSAGANVEVRVRVTSAAISASNPEYRFQVAPTSYGMGGKVDELATKSLSWPVSGVVARVVTP